MNTYNIKYHLSDGEDFKNTIVYAQNVVEAINQVMIREYQKPMIFDEIKEETEKEKRKRFSHKNKMNEREKAVKKFVRDLEKASKATKGSKMKFIYGGGGFDD